jgi:hypothetical protein
MTKTALRLTILALSFLAFAGSVAAEQGRTQNTTQSSDTGTLRSWSITFP